MSAGAREIRELAFQVLFQIDGQDDGSQRPVDLERLREFLEPPEHLKSGDINRAMRIANQAWDARAGADTELEALAPEWRVARMAATDRALLRLAHFEMSSGMSPPKAVVSESVDLARKYGTNKSPAFVNGLLDKVLKRVLREAATVEEN